MPYPSKVEKTLEIKIFGQITAIRKARKCVTWCKCSCGNEKAIKAADLLEGKVTHCGCLSDNRTKAMKDADLMVEEGYTKDMLKVIAIDEDRTTRQKAFVICECDCGEIKSYDIQCLHKLHYGSCGCYKPKILKPSPATSKVIDQKYFTNLTVLSWAGDDARYVNCKCVCGNKKRIRSDSLLSGDTKSCGCLAKEEASKRFKGKFKPNAVTRHPLYGRYKGMFGRCYNENNADYKHYGARGISVCDRWTSPPRDLTGFFNFIEDMESSYFDDSEIERINVNGNYSPDNCTWVCRKSQVNNLRRNRRLRGFGIELNVVEWGEFLNFNCKMLDDRLNHLKWEGELEDILEITFKDRGYSLLYKGNVRTATYIWDAEGFTLGQRNGRITKHGCSIEALKAEGIEFELIKPREKDYYNFEEALDNLRNKDRDLFEDHLLFKIESQLKERKLDK